MHNHQRKINMCRDAKEKWITCNSNFATYWSLNEHNEKDNQNGSIKHNIAMVWPNLHVFGRSLKIHVLQSNQLLYWCATEITEVTTGSPSIFHMVTTTVASNKYLTVPYCFHFSLKAIILQSVTFNSWEFLKLPDLL